MKLKYKKMILLTTMSTMGIGLLTLSLSKGSSKADETKRAGSANEVNTMAMADTVDADDISTFSVTDKLEAVLPGATPTTVPTSALTPTPTPIPVYPLEDPGTYPKIDALVKDYFAAKASCDLDKIKSLLSDPEKSGSREWLQSKTEYIEDYRNIKAYTKKGLEEGTYIVFAYHEVKFTGINTMAPSISKFFVTTDESGALKIFAGTIDENFLEYYEARNNDEDVLALKEDVEKKFKKAKKSDEDLNEFSKDIDELIKSNSTEKK